MESPWSRYVSYSFWTFGNAALQYGHVGKKNTTSVALPSTSGSVFSAPSRVFSLKDLSFSAFAAAGHTITKSSAIKTQPRRHQDTEIRSFRSFVAPRLRGILSQASPPGRMTSGVFGSSG